MSKKSQSPSEAPESAQAEATQDVEASATSGGPPTPEEVEAHHEAEGGPPPAMEEAGPYDEQAVQQQMMVPQALEGAANAMPPEAMQQAYTQAPVQQMAGEQAGGGLKGSEKMRKAYRAASKMAQSIMEQEAPEDLEYLKEIGDSDVIVLRGQYDHGEAIFEMAEIPYTLINPDEIERVELRDDQIIFVNCPGSRVTDRGIERIKSFVDKGGMLVTTDWGLKHVLEKAFPGIVRYNGKATADDVVRIVYAPVEDTFLKGLLDPQDDPQWWLEGSSYPIEIIDKKRVFVLVSSKEMEEKYGHAPIVIAFEYGAGKVYHMTSHFYLQRSETRDKRHKAKGTNYAAQKGLSMAVFSDEEASFLDETDLASVESAYTSVRSIKNVIVEQKMRVKKRKK